MIVEKLKAMDQKYELKRSLFHAIPTISTTLDLTKSRFFSHEVFAFTRQNFSPHKVKLSSILVLGARKMKPSRKI